MPRKEPKREASPKEVRDRNELFEEYEAHYQRSNSAGKVKAGPKGFSAIVIRKGDDHDQIRGCEYVNPGDVVQLPIDRAEGSYQSPGAVAWMRATGQFEPTQEAMTDPPLDDVYHGTMTTAEAHAVKTANAPKDPGELMTITRGQIQDIVAAAVAQALSGQAAPAAPAA